MIQLLGSMKKRMAIEKDPIWELDYAVMLVSKKSKDFAKA